MRATIIIGVLALVLAVVVSGRLAADFSSPSEIGYTDFYIVGYTGYDMPEEAGQYIDDVDGEISQDWPEIAYAVVRGISEDEAESLGAIAGVTSVTRDVRVRWIPELAEVQVRELQQPEIESHDPAGAFFFPIQWNMRQIDADDAWAAGFEAPGVLVAILDTGINTSHVDMFDFSDFAGFTPIVDVGLSRNVLSFTTPFCAAGGETFAPSTSTDDFNFHGTHVGGIVNTNGFGVAGVAPHATLVAVKVLNCEGFGSFADVITGILYAASVPVDVINMSLGADIPNQPAFAPLLNALTSAVQVALDAEVYVVASAGNLSRGLPEVEGVGELLSVPCQSHEGVACISATGPVFQTNFDRLAFYSNFGEEVISVAAPGGDFVGNVFDFVLSPCSRSSLIIPICQTGNFVLPLVGTSQAAPHVSGAAALVDSQFGGALGGMEIKAIIEGTADEDVVPDLGDIVPVKDGRRLNVFEALTE